MYKIIYKMPQPPNLPQPPKKAKKAKPQTQAQTHPKQTRAPKKPRATRKAGKQSFEGLQNVSITQTKPVTVAAKLDSTTPSLGKLTQTVEVPSIKIIGDISRQKKLDIEIKKLTNKGKNDVNKIHSLQKKTYKGLSGMISKMFRSKGQRLANDSDISQLHRDAFEDYRQKQLKTISKKVENNISSKTENTQNKIMSNQVTKERLEILTTKQAEENVAKQTEKSIKKQALQDAAAEVTKKMNMTKVAEKKVAEDFESRTTFEIAKLLLSPEEQKLSPQEQKKLLQDLKPEQRKNLINAKLDEKFSLYKKTLTPEEKKNLTPEEKATEKATFIKNELDKMTSKAQLSIISRKMPIEDTYKLITGKEFTITPAELAKLTPDELKIIQLSNQETITLSPEKQLELKTQRFIKTKKQEIETTISNTFNKLSSEEQLAKLKTANTNTAKADAEYKKKIDTQKEKKENPAQIFINKKREQRIINEIELVKSNEIKLVNKNPLYQKLSEKDQRNKALSTIKNQNDIANAKKKVNDANQKEHLKKERIESKQLREDLKDPKKKLEIEKQSLLNKQTIYTNLNTKLSTIRATPIQNLNIKKNSLTAEIQNLNNKIKKINTNLPVSNFTERNKFSSDIATKKRELNNLNEIKILRQLKSKLSNKKRLDEIDIQKNFIDKTKQYNKQQKQFSNQNKIDLNTLQKTTQSLTTTNKKRYNNLLTKKSNLFFNDEDKKQYNNLQKQFDSGKTLSSDNQTKFTLLSKGFTDKVKFINLKNKIISGTILSPTEKTLLNNLNKNVNDKTIITKQNLNKLKTTIINIEKSRITPFEQTKKDQALNAEFKKRTDIESKKKQQITNINSVITDLKAKQSIPTNPLNQKLTNRITNLESKKKSLEIPNTYTNNRLTYLTSRKQLVDGIDTTLQQRNNGGLKINGKQKRSEFELELAEIKKLDNEAELAEINNKTLKKQIIKEEKTKLKSEKIAAHLKKQTQETAELEHQKKLKSAKQTIQKSEENKIISKAQALALEEKQKLSSIDLDI